MALQELFQKYGEMISLKLKSKQTEKGPVNFAFVEYGNATAAMNAMRDLDGHVAYGQGSRPLRYFSFFGFRICFLRLKMVVAV